MQKVYSYRHSKFQQRHQLFANNKFQYHKNITLTKTALLVRGERSIIILHNTNTKSLAKEFLEILIFEYFGYLKMGLDVSFDADSESPRMT